MKKMFNDRIVEVAIIGIVIGCIIGGTYYLQQHLRSLDDIEMYFDTPTNEDTTNIA
jgi:hypothetical protein